MTPIMALHVVSARWWLGASSEAHAHDADAFHTQPGCELSRRPNMRLLPQSDELWLLLMVTQVGLWAGINPVTLWACTSANSGLLLLLADRHFWWPLCAAVSLNYWCATAWIAWVLSPTIGVTLMLTAVFMRSSALLFPPKGKGRRTKGYVLPRFDILTLVRETGIKTSVQSNWRRTYTVEAEDFATNWCELVRKLCLSDGIELVPNKDIRIRLLDYNQWLGSNASVATHEAPKLPKSRMKKGTSDITRKRIEKKRCARLRTGAGRYNFDTDFWKSQFSEDISDETPQETYSRYPDLHVFGNQVILIHARKLRSRNMEPQQERDPVLTQLLGTASASSATHDNAETVNGAVREGEDSRAYPHKALFGQLQGDMQRLQKQGLDSRMAFESEAETSHWRLSASRDPPEKERVEDVYDTILGEEELLQAYPTDEHEHHFQFVNADMLGILQRKSKSIGVLRPINHATDSYATAFLTSPSHLVTCLHNLYEICSGESDDNNQFCFPPHFTCNLECLFPGLNVTINFSYDDIVYPEKHNELKNIGMDIAIVKLTDTEAKKLVVVLEQDMIIHIVNPSRKPVPFMDPSKINDSFRQPIHIMGFQLKHVVPKKQQSNDHAPTSASAATSSKHELKISWRNNSILAFHNWEVLYSSFCGPVPRNLKQKPALQHQEYVGPKEGLSGAPGLNPHGELICVHRFAYKSVSPRRHFSAHQWFCAGTRIDLFLSDEFACYTNGNEIQAVTLENRKDYSGFQPKPGNLIQEIISANKLAHPHELLRECIVLHAQPNVIPRYF